MNSFWQSHIQLQKMSQKIFGCVATRQMFPPSEMVVSSALKGTSGHIFARNSIPVQRFCCVSRKSKFCCSCTAGKKKKVLFIDLYVEIRERKQKSTYHETFLSSLKKTNNNKNVALPKFESSCEYLVTTVSSDSIAVSVAEFKMN